MLLRYGDIAIVSGLPDPFGRNPKDRPVVIVTPTDELREGRPIFVVAITTTLPDPLPDDYITLPWSRPRHPRTGLNSRNAVVCHWLVEVELSRVLRTIGRAPASKLDEIEEILRRLAGESGGIGR